MVVDSYTPTDNLSKKRSKKISHSEIISQDFYSSDKSDKSDAVRIYKFVFFFYTPTHCQAHATYCVA